MIAFTTDIGINQFMQIRDVTDGEIVSQTEANLGVYVPLDWHPSENIIATGGQDGSVRIWDALDSSEIIELPVHEDTVNDIGWSPDGSMLASLGRDGRVFIWRASDLVGQDAIH
jgi:WD40 repeat protein